MRCNDSLSRRFVFCFFFFFVVAVMFLQGCGGTSSDGSGSTSTTSAAATISSISPTSVTAGGADFTLTVTGSGFISSSQIFWNGAACTTTFVSSTSLTTDIPASDIASAGTINIAVMNGDVASAAVTFKVTTPVGDAPLLSSISPQSAVAGSGDLILTLQGENFAPGSTVAFGTENLSILGINSNTITATVPADLLAKTGDYPVTVTTPASGTSNAATFHVTTPPPPAITQLMPSQVIEGASNLSLNVYGNGFVQGATVEWQGSPLTTNFVSSSNLVAAVPDDLVASAGVFPITVAIPQGTNSVFTTPAVDFTVKALPAGQFIINQTANDIVWDAQHKLLYASVPSAETNYGSDVIAIDPATGKIVNSVFAGSDPDLMAISGDGQFLYVALDGSSSVQRFKLPSLAADITVSLGADPFFGANTALDLAVAPGAPHTWAVTVGNLGVSPAAQGGLSVYDDATQRGSSEGRDHFQGNGGFDLLLGTITWGKDATVIYGANNESTGFDFYSIPISATGPGIITDYGGAMPGFDNAHIHFDPVTKLVYGDNGYIVNPTTGGAAGQYAYYGPMVPDGTLNQAYFVNDGTGGQNAAGTIAAFNLTKFSPTGLYVFPNVIGSPRRLVRWGSNGLAFNSVNYNYGGPTVTKTGKIFIYSGSLVTGAPKS